MDGCLHLIKSPKPFQAEHLKPSFVSFQVAILPESALTDKSIRELHALTCRYQQWVRLWAEEEARVLAAYEDLFEQRLNKFK